MRKPTKCAGFDEQGRAFACPNKPGTRFTDSWCAECDKRRMASLNRDFEKIRIALGMPEWRA